MSVPRFETPESQAGYKRFTIGDDTMKLTEQERAALVEELAEAMFAALGPIKQEIYQESDALLTFAEWRNMQGYDSIGDDDSWALTVDKFNVLVSGAASVIDRLLAERELDALLDRLKAQTALIEYDIDVDWSCWLDDTFHGNGQTPTEALRDAVAQAQGRGEGA